MSQKIEYRYFYSCRINQKLLACEQKKKKKKKRNIKEAAIAQTGGHVPLLGGRPKSVNDDILIEFIKTPVLNGISADPCRRTEKKVLLIKAEFGRPATSPEEKDGIKGQCYEKVSHYVPLFSGY